MDDVHEAQEQVLRLQEKVEVCEYQLWIPVCMFTVGENLHVYNVHVGSSPT